MSLAISNSAGGIAVQTVFVVVADLVYRRANIEHAAASLINLFNAFLLVALLALVVLAVAGPQGTLAGVHPVTVLLVGFYLYGIRLSRSVGRERMWRPLETSETRRDVPADEGRGARLPPMLLALAGLTAMVGLGGFVVGRSGLVVVEATGLSGTVVGILLTSIVTSLPELVTTVAAVRSGALTLAIGGLVGGNSFDVLFIGFADVAFRGGSLYERAGGDDVFVLGWTMLLVAVLGAGLVRRERRGIGFEGIGILVLYVAGAAVVVSMG